MCCKNNTGSNCKNEYYIINLIVQVLKLLFSLERDAHGYNEYLMQRKYTFMEAAKLDYTVSVIC